MKQGYIVTKYQRKDGRLSWGYVLEVGKDENGRRRQEKRQGFHYQREAEAAVAARRRQLGLAKAATTTQDLTSAQIIEPLRARITFGQVLDQFLSEETINCTLGTLEMYRKSSRYPRRDLGDVPIDSITSSHLQNLFTRLRTVGGDKGKPLRPKTLRHIRFLLKCVFDLAVRKKHIAATPLTKDVRTPKIRKKKFQMPEIHRLKAVLQEARAYRLYEILELPAATGIRLGELCALLRTDFDPENGSLTISKSLEDTKHGVRVKPTKSEEPRTVQLPPYIITMLEEHLRRQDNEKSHMGVAYNDQGYLFCPPWGGFYRPSNVSKRVSFFLGKRLGLSMHGLRHAHASHLLSQGADIQSVSDRLGHADPSITLELYSHAIPSDRGRLAHLWDEVWQSESHQSKLRLVPALPNVTKQAKESA